MGRARRSFKLRLSSAGLDVLIDSHCHLIRVTRSLMAWGTTLHVAVEHLSTLPTDIILNRLKEADLDALSGNEEHHVGASNGLWDIAAGILQRLQGSVPEGRSPTMGAIYIVALLLVTAGDSKSLLQAYERAVKSGARTPASTNTEEPAE